MPYQTRLIYFRPTGKILTIVDASISGSTLLEIWSEIHALRRLGRLPGLRPNAGRDLFIVVDVPDHPQRELHLVLPPFVDEDDVTPARIPTGEMLPLMRVPLAELPRTSTRDVLRVDVPDASSTDEEVTPVHVPIPKL